MAKAKYNVIFMRDDASVKRWRISSWSIKLFVYLLISLVIISILSTYLAINFFQEKEGLRLSLMQTTKLLNDTKFKLKRLENVQKILDSYNGEQLEGLLVKHKLNTSGTNLAGAIDLNEVFQSVDLHMVKIENVQARYFKDKMQVQFELNNLTSGRTIKGEVNLYLIGRDGMEVDLSVESQKHYFEINRFKRIKATFVPPEFLPRPEIFAIRIKIVNQKGKTIFCETYPLSHILV
ncbi:hypothetical protein [Desulfovulcanus sp.]